MPITGGRNLIVRNGSQSLFVSTGADLGNSSPVVLNNTAIEASVIGEGVGSLIIPAARFEQNAKFRVIASGTYLNGSSLPSVLFRLKINSTTKVENSMPAVDDSDVEQQWKYVLDIIYVGGTTFTYYVKIEYNSDNETAGFTWRDDSGTFEADVSAGATIDFTAQWTAIGNVLRVQTFELIEVPIPVDQPLALIGFTSPTVTIPTGLQRVLWTSMQLLSVNAEDTLEHTMLGTTASGSLQLATGFLSAIGSRLRFEVHGTLSNSALPPAPTFRFKLNESAIAIQIDTPEADLFGPNFVLNFELFTSAENELSGLLRVNWSQLTGEPAQERIYTNIGSLSISTAQIFTAGLTLRYSDVDFSTGMSIRQAFLHFHNPPSQ